MKFNLKKTALAVGLTLASFSASAAQINWADWQSNTGYSSGPIQIHGVMNTPTASVDVTYANQHGLHFFYLNGGADFWTDNYRQRDPQTSPYTSDAVENIPTGTDLIALNQAGNQTLSFSEPVANLVFSYVSLNGNGYAFDQDFEILSFGHHTNGNNCGYWGCGTSYKEVVDLGDGKFEYRLLGTGEPHGTIRFLGKFDTISWRSMSYETWNGFTVGIEGTADEVNTDNDGDGVKDTEDNCPTVYNPVQADADGDGLGDACDPYHNGPVDSDGDGVPDTEDAFPNDPSEQYDTDGDGVGDNADAFPNDPNETTDSDGDGVGDNSDAFPNDPNETTDTDGDGIGDNSDSNNNSDLSDNVSIGDNETTVENRLYDNGETLADKVNGMIAECTENSRNHGQFASCSAKSLNGLVAEGTITEEEKDLLQSAAGSSDTAKPEKSKGRSK